MLAKRVILSLLFNEGVLSRTKRFVADYRYTKAFSCNDEADQVILLDITRSGAWPGFSELVETYCRRLSIPIMVGGHVRSIDYAFRLLNAGSFGVVVGWAGKEVYEKIAGQVGSQAVTAGIDIGQAPEGRHGVPICEITQVCQEAVSRGAGEILLTSIARDGSLGGYDVSTLQACVQAVRVPVVAAGGCGSWSHMKAAFEAGAQGAATSNIFHLNATAMRSCKQWLTANYDGAIRPTEAT